MPLFFSSIHFHRTTGLDFKSKQVSCESTEITKYYLTFLGNVKKKYDIIGILRLLGEKIAKNSCFMYMDLLCVVFIVLKPAITKEKNSSLLHRLTFLFHNCTIRKGSLQIFYLLNS